MIWKPGILSCDTVIQHANSSNSNIRDSCDKELQDKTNQICSLNMIVVHEINVEPRAINAEQPFDWVGIAFGPPWTTQDINNIRSSMGAVKEVMALLDQHEPPNFPETMRMEKFEQDTKTVVLQNPEYQETTNSSQTATCLISWVIPRTR